MKPKIYIIVFALGLTSCLTLGSSGCGGLSVAQDRGKVAEKQLEVFHGAAEAYLKDVGNYPSSLDELAQRPDSVSETKWKGPYVEGPIPADPWDSPYDIAIVVDREGEFQAIIRSYGPDRRPDTSDDITNLKN